MRGAIAVGAALVATLLLPSSHAQRDGGAPAVQVRQAIRAGRLDAALTQAEAYLKVNPRNDGMWTLKAIALQLKGDTAAASVAFDRALRLAPANPAALRGKIQVLYARGDGLASPLLERLLAVAPADPVAREMLANLQARDGRCRQALDNFQAVRDAVAAHAESEIAFAGCLIEERRPEEALGPLTRLTEAYPNRAALLYDLALAMNAAGRKQEAVTVVDRLLAVDRSPDTLALASDIYESAGETPKAVDLLREAIVAAPATAQYYVSFTALCVAHESFQAGLQMLQAGLARLPKEPSLYIARGLLLAQTAKYDEAETDFATAEQLDAGLSVGAFATDIAELQRRQSNLAAEDIRLQLTRHPQSPLLHLLLAKTLWAEKHPDGVDPAEAIREARRAIDLQPTLTEAHDLLADIDLASEHYSDAIAQSEQSLRIDPADQTALYHLITACRHTEDDALKAKLPDLVRRLSEMKRLAREEELRRKSFSLQAQPDSP